MRIEISKIKKAAKLRPEGYVEDIMSRGTLDEADAEWLVMPDHVYHFLVAKYQNPAPPLEPPPAAESVSKELPSFLTMAGNAFKAVAMESAAYIAGSPEVSQEDIEKRTSICNGCDRFIKEVDRCAECGCFLQYKTRLRSQHCPLDKW